MAISKIIYKQNAQDTGTVWMDATPATAVAADITAPKTAMLADGILTTGTGSGGGGGLEYETGTYTPVSDISQPTISFTNTHTDPPAIIVVSNNRSTSSAPASDAVMMWTYFDKYKMFGGGFQYNSSSIGYSYEEYLYNSTGGSAGGSRAYTANNSSETGQGNTYPSYYTTNTAFTPIGSSSRKFISGETYKWVAVWAPST